MEKRCIQPYWKRESLQRQLGRELYEDRRNRLSVKEVRILKRLFVLILIVVAVLYGCSTNNTNKNRELNTIKAGTDNNSSKINKTKNNAVSKKPPVVLYRGLTLDKNDENVNIIEETDAALKKRLLAKYETDYYLYSDGNYLGNAKGKVEGVGLYCYWEVVFPEEENAAEIAISPNYNLYPRKINYINSKLPEELDNGGKVLSDINSQFKVDSLLKELCYVDLDGDSKNEYLALVVDEKKCFFAKCLLDSNFKVIAYVLAFQEQREDFKQVVEDYNLKESGEVADINNDGILEIIVDMPIYEGFDFKVFTYKNGAFNGDFINKGSFQP